MSNIQQSFLGAVVEQCINSAPVIRFVKAENSLHFMQLIGTVGVITILARKSTSRCFLLIQLVERLVVHWRHIRALVGCHQRTIALFQLFFLVLLGETGE